MSGQSKWKEEQILICCPGSQTTMAQLGCSELTPPLYRFPTRMFRDVESGSGWRPYHTFRRKKAKKAVVVVADPVVADGEEGALGGEVKTNGNGVVADAAAGENGVAKTVNKEDGAKEEDEFEYVEDPDSVEGAVYPMRAGHIVNMPAFLAFLDHVHSMLTTTYHNTPIVLMASPQWTRPDCEEIAGYIFEKTKTPALCLLHSGVATQYGLKWPSMTVVDVGFEKVDVTCLFDSHVVAHRDVGPKMAKKEEEGGVSGGEVFTKRLVEALKGKGFDYEMAEQLKKSHICEVLPYAPEEPALIELPVEIAPPPAPVATAAPAVTKDTSTPVPPADAVVEPPTAASEASGTTLDGPKIVEPTGQPKLLSTDAGDMDVDTGDEPKADEGVLDIAGILTSGQTKEFLAKKERDRERAEKMRAAKKAKADGGNADSMSRPVRLPNSKRMKAMFHYEKAGEVEAEAPKADGVATEAPPPPKVEAPTTEPTTVSEPTSEAQPAASAPAAPTPTTIPAPAPSSTVIPSDSLPKRSRHDIEIGLERFTFAERSEIDRIVEAIYSAIQNIDDLYMRPACWDNLVFVGNGARLRGLKDNIIQTLMARHLISPSSATMFTSELPSNLGTPSGTGSQTPTAGTPRLQNGVGGGPQLGMMMPPSSSVNPLLQAATTSAFTPAGGAGPETAAAAVPASHSHSQTPTSIKLAPLPTYLAEWTKNGFEEAMFLGAQVAARLAFCVHNLDAQGLEAQRAMSLNRVEYNEMGPKAIRTHSMLG